MKWQFTNPLYLALLLPAAGWLLWFHWKSDVQTAAWRRWTALVLRGVVVVALVLAMAGLQWLHPREGMNVIFLLDRSDSIPSSQQEAARRYVNDAAKNKKKEDRVGLLVFGGEAAIETSPAETVDPNNTKILAVVNSERTDIAAAIRLGTAAFPEHGQKRLVLLSDGNENLDNALSAMMSARPLGVTLDVVPLGTQRTNDVAVQKLSLPGRVKKGQTFDARILVTADQPQDGLLRIYRNEAYLGETAVKLDKGKNLFTLPQTLEEPGFYSYRVTLEAAGDGVPQNNKAASFINVRGEPRVLLVSANPEEDRELARVLRAAALEVRHLEVAGLSGSLAELQSYETIFISNLSAGDLGRDRMKLLESAVRDFGVGLVCVGGDQTYAAGSYRGTPLETTLPVNMELDSKKVLPRGALALLMHGMEFPGANQTARETALAALSNLGPQDEMGVLLWDGNERWLFQLAPVGDKKAMGKAIAGMNQGDLPSFHNLMTMGYAALKNSKANLKHLIIFSDGDPNPPTDELLDQMVKERITISTVMIGGHVMPDRMIMMAEKGRGRFYDVPQGNAANLPDIFIKESAVVLKSAIFEEPFQPKVAAASEVVRGIQPGEYPALLGYVCTTPKGRAEIPLVSDKGDPLLAHWQYGLGRAVAFTSDAKSRWAKNWLGWDKYRQFWAQVAQWSLRRLENADFATEISVDKGEGHLGVDAVDENGEYRNFLDLQAVVVSPKGERQTVPLEQTGPGHYEARFPTREVGTYVVNLLEVRDGRPRGSLVLGASVNYSPEFADPDPNANLLKQLADYGGGRVLDPSDPADNPFLHDRQRTFQPKDLFEWLLRLAILLFVADVGVRRIQVDRDEWARATATLRNWLFFWQGRQRPLEADESLAALLARRGQVRSRTTAAKPAEPSPDLFKPRQAPAPAKPPETSSPSPAPLPAAPPAPDSPAAAPPAAASVTDRLLEAKRRAQRKKS